MNKIEVIIYGINHQAQQLKVLLEKEGETDVIGFVVDRPYKNCNNLLGLPVFEFEMLEDIFPPDNVQIVLSFGYKNMVQNRMEKFIGCKGKGYTLYTYVSKYALVYTNEIGEGSIVYPKCFLAPHSKIGKGCFLENGVSVAHDTVLGDFVFCAPGANICGDIKIENNCFIGASSTVAGAITLGRRTLVAAGAVCLKSTDESTICFPGKPVYFVDRIPENFI